MLESIKEAARGFKDGLQDQSGATAQQEWERQPLKAKLMELAVVVLAVLLLVALFVKD